MVNASDAREDLFLPYPFFHDFDYFLEVEILSKDLDSFHRWKGLIQARLRYLLTYFEQEIEPKSKISFRLWPQEFNVHLPNQPEYKYACYYYIGLKSNTYNSEVVNLTQIVKQWKTSVYEQWEGSPADNHVFFIHKKRNELETFVYETTPRDLYTWTGDITLFPQAHDPSNLLSKLQIPDNQVYLPNNLSYMLGGYQGPPAQSQLNPLLQFGPLPQAPVANPHDHIGHLSEGGAPSK